MAATSTVSALMRVIRAGTSKKTYPTGNPNFAVMQSFPASISATDSDPFLMCDHFGPTLSNGVETDPDSFPIPWHPHRGMDILTYIVSGTGRHGDSMGNRETFASPGMQWISVGSGIEHAEGGGTPAGEKMEGFQIWVNVPSERKMDDPRYGTEPPENIPTFTADGLSARVMAGEVAAPTGATISGPFKTVADVQMVDFTLSSGASHVHPVPSQMDNAIAYVYRGSGIINGAQVNMHDVVHLDAKSADTRGLSLTAALTSADFQVILFAGKRLNEPIAWHGPFVMNTDAEIQQTIRAYQSPGKKDFFKKRVPWNYKQLSDFPPDHIARTQAK